MSRDTAFVVVDHPTIGRVRGLKWSDSINRYLGLQYATLADRFSRAELIQYTEVTHDQDNDDVEYGSGGANSILDATRFGYGETPIPNVGVRIKNKLTGQCRWFPGKASKANGQRTDRRLFFLPMPVRASKISSRRTWTLPSCPSPTPVVSH